MDKTERRILMKKAYLKLAAEYEERGLTLLVEKMRQAAARCDDTP